MADKLIAKPTANKGQFTKMIKAIECVISQLSWYRPYYNTRLSTFDSLTEQLAEFLDGT